MTKELPPVRRNQAARLRALDDLRNGYAADIRVKFEGLETPVKTAQRAFKDPNQKAVAEELAAAADKIAKKYGYTLRHRSVCKIAHDTYIEIAIDIDKTKFPEPTRLQKQLEKIQMENVAAERRLKDWYRKQLYNVTNDKDIAEFKV